MIDLWMSLGSGLEAQKNKVHLGQETGLPMPFPINWLIRGAPTGGACAT